MNLKTSEHSNKETIMFVHAAWGGGWEYKEMERLFLQLGYNVFRPTLTGLGEREHLGSESIRLATHITDIVNCIEYEELQDVILVGHSYSGMVVMGVAEQIPERIKHLICIDAFIPDDGDSVQSINGDIAWNKMMQPHVRDGFVQFPFGETGTDTPRKVKQSLHTFTDALTVENGAVRKIPSSYILMNNDSPAQFEKWGASRARKRDWDILTMDGDHYPMKNQPENLAEIIMNTLIK